MPESIPKQLFFDFFDGKSTASQKQWMAEWLKDPRNRAVYYQYLDEWESQHPQFRAAVPDAIARFREAIQTPDSGQPSPSFDVTSGGFRGFRAVWMWAAAAVLLLTVGGFLGRDLIQYQTYQTSFGQTQSFQLVDGTWVALNANSTLRVPRWGFGAKKREVILDGEAEFKVTHLPNNQRFIVKTSTDFAVEVLGTEFMVYAREKRRKVVLSQGKVKVTYQPGKQVLMRPGDWVMLDGAGDLQRRKTANPSQFTGWKQHRFTFDHTSLAEISQLIRENFGQTLDIRDSTLAQRQVSGVFEAERPEELVDALADLLHLRLIKTDTSLELQAYPDSVPDSILP